MVRYNGGLFDPQQHPFLVQKSVGDRAFTCAIDLLCRRETATGKEFVDYRTLNVRHLGSIYEGLLEYQPRRAVERMVAIRNGKGEQWMPAVDAPQGAKVVERRAEGEIYLETDKGERKATGSYYTPQYIVAYIVEQTLGPLVAGILDEIKAAAMPTAEAGRAFVARTLALKVLDPSMGSGHFLVEATDYLARAWPPIPTWRRKRLRWRATSTTGVGASSSAASMEWIRTRWPWSWPSSACGSPPSPAISPWASWIITSSAAIPWWARPWTRSAMPQRWPKITAVITAWPKDRRTCSPTCSVSACRW